MIRVNGQPNRELQLWFSGPADNPKVEGLEPGYIKVSHEMRDILTEALHKQGWSMEARNIDTGFDFCLWYWIYPLEAHKVTERAAL